MTRRRMALGMSGEKAAAAFLESAGFTIRECRYTTRFAEVDLIATRNDRLVFVEVKARSNTRKGMPRESVTPAKQKKIIQAAQWFLKTHPDYGRHHIRFDVVELVRQNSQWEITHIPNAFGAG